MNYVGVVQGDEELQRKIACAKAHGKVINGHAPLLSGKALDAYIACGIRDDHECTSEAEAKERIRKGQRVMIRQGPNSQNLRSLLPLFEEPWASRCMLVIDDKLPADLIHHGHIDDMIRVAAKEGKNVITAIRMATLSAAEAYGLTEQGAIAPGYAADIVVLDDLNTFAINSVYRAGELVAEQGKACSFADPVVPPELEQAVRQSFYMQPLTPDDLCIAAKDPSRRTGKRPTRVISVIPGELLTDEKMEEINYDVSDGVDVSRDLLKLAVIERHKNTGHIGLGYIQGIGMERGAMAASVSHDAHNLIVIGASDPDMVVAGNRVRELGGGFVVVEDGQIISEMPLPIAGLMGDRSAEQMEEANAGVREAVYRLGIPRSIKPFLTMAFVSLPVIPHLKMTTRGLVYVDRQQVVDLTI
jgi:adenine deaminase